MIHPPLKNFSLVLTGSTGMVGEGVLLECLQHPEVTRVLVINRRPSGVVHPKVKEILHTDFFDWSSIEGQLEGYDACFFCMGVSSIGMKEQDFTHLTYELTLKVAGTLLKHNKSMTFCYISGAGTDSSEKGRMMWARVKGKTENDLLKLPFNKVYLFRPGILQPTPGATRTIRYYRYFMWLLPLIKWMAPRYICSLKELGKAMIHVTIQGYEKPVLEVRDILVVAKR